MALCDNCTFMDKRYDQFRQDYNDAVPTNEKLEQHFCPMYEDHIPNGIYYSGDNCQFFDAKE